MVSLSASVGHHARTRPACEALLYGVSRITYAQLHERVLADAGLLGAHGIAPGSVVALLMKNSAAFIELAIAISHVGAVLLPINYRLGADEVAFILDHSGAALLFVDEELEYSAGSFPQKVVVDTAAQSDSRKLGGRAGALSTAAHAGRPGDLFRLMYTSGTTDRPKGVMHSYENYMWKCLDHITALGMTAQDRLLVIGPLYHVGAFDLPGLAVLLCGGLLAVQRDFDPETALRQIERERLTGAWMAPVMLNRCLAHGRGNLDLESFRWLIGGGERTPEERIREFGSLFPKARYIDAYGLTESCSGDTFMEAGREIEKIGSTGRALAHVELEIRDDHGARLGSGEFGEVCLRGPKVSQGYWKDPVKTQASFHADWFRTGDVGYLDEEGFLYLTDRKKDMIISGGENIASSEVERVLYQLPQVVEAAAIGLPDPDWGERVTAVLVLKPGETLTLEQVRGFFEGRLGGFKTPKQLVLLDALPRNASGKVLKRVLREQLTGEGRTL